VTIGASELQVENRPAERIGLPRSGLEARFNWEYLIASAIVRGPFEHAHLADEAVVEESVVAFMPRVHVVIDPELRDNAEYGVRVTVRYKDGRERERVMPTYRGWPTDPLTEAEFKSKFVANASRCFTPAGSAAAFDAVRHFAAVGNVADVIARLVSNARRDADR
jgi:2-methylcitrate dehydratase PrpD